MLTNCSTSFSSPEFLCHRSAVLHDSYLVQGVGPGKVVHPGRPVLALHPGDQERYALSSLLGFLPKLLEMYLIAHNNTKVRTSAAFLLVSLEPYINISLHGTDKLVSYFQVMTHLLLSKNKKQLLGTHFAVLVQCLSRLYGGHPAHPK